jgi:hypothetical protein
MTVRAEPMVQKLIHPCQNTFIRGDTFLMVWCWFKKSRESPNLRRSRGWCSKLTLKKHMIN